MTMVFKASKIEKRTRSVSFFKVYIKQLKYPVTEE